MLINKTPHLIKVTGGPTLEPALPPARVKAEFRPAEAQPGALPVSLGGDVLRLDGVTVYAQEFGEILDLPEPAAGTIYVVSAIVLAAAKKAGRQDCVAPATGHPDVVRDEQGRIVSVPGFVG